MNLTHPSYVVLGMIAAGARTGYDIARTAQHSTRFFWAASEGQIYPQLRKLAGAGLIAGTTESQGERERIVYELTDTGRAALDAWLADEAPLKHELRDEGMLKLFFSDRLTVAAMRTQLALMRERHDVTARRLREVEAGGVRRPSGFVTLRTGLALHGAFSAWFAQLEEALAGADEDALAAPVIARALGGDF